jgi:hypothetical protein
MARRYVLNNFGFGFDKVRETLVEIVMQPPAQTAERR